MASTLANLVRQTTTSTGTSTLTLAAASGYQTFATAFGTGSTTNVFQYSIVDATNGAYEMGTGHMSDATTLVRDTVVFSSNSNNAVNFSAGTKVVLCSPTQPQLKKLEATPSDGYALCGNSNDALGVTYQQMGIPAAPGYVSASWYSTFSGGAFSTATLASGGTTLYLAPIYISQRTAFTNIGAWVTSTGTATAAHMGVYTGIPISGQSMSLVSGTDVTATISSGGNAVLTSSFTNAVTLDKGWYALAFFANGGVTINSAANGAHASILGSQDLNTTSRKIGLTGQTYGALSTTITVAITNENSGLPLLGLKAQ